MSTSHCQRRSWEYDSLRSKHAGGASRERGERRLPWGQGVEELKVRLGARNGEVEWCFQNWVVSLFFCWNRLEG